MSRLFQNVDSEQSFNGMFRYGLQLNSGAFASVHQVVNRKNAKVIAAAKRVKLVSLESTFHQVSKKEVISVIFFCFVKFESFFLSKFSIRLK